MVSISQSNSSNDELVLQSGLDAAIAAATGSSSILRSNVSGTVIVDMGAADYTMTDAQAQCNTIFITNEGTGRTLTWPASSNGLWPLQQVVVMSFATNTVIMKPASGSSDTLLAGFVHQVEVVPNSGAFNLDDLVADQTRSSGGPTRTMGALNTNVTDQTLNGLFIADDVGAQTLTIPDTLETPNAFTKFVCGGAGGLTITAGGATVITGNAVFASGQSGAIQRDDLTNNWRILR